jgi:3-hydroxyacyl-CoA dehydrogenase/enoyl-CoA hydratase/3-hydroxybutyryl-CoA epimerase
MPNILRKTTNDNICVLTFDRNSSPANIFDKATLLEMEEHIDAVWTEKPAGLVFVSAKENIFIAGADLNTLAGVHEKEILNLLEMGQTVFKHIASLKIPTVAAIHGACLGGGYELCLACAYRIATPDRATRIGLPEINLGILPAWGGSTRLPRLIGLPGALDVILAGKTVPADQALKRGMIDMIAPREYLMREALRIARGGKQHRLIARIRHSPPINQAVALAIKRVVHLKTVERTRGHYPAPLIAAEVMLRPAAIWSSSASLALEREAVTALTKTETSRNLLRLFFLQEQARKLFYPTALKLPPRKVSRAAVIGAGVMGASIVQWLSAREVRVVMRDVDAERVAAGMERIRQLYANGRKRHTFTYLEARDGYDRISPSPSEFSMKGVEIIVEAAVEQLDLKKRIFARLDEQAPPETILATNTSALSINEIAAATKNPERVIGIHFFNPVHKMHLVEVVVGRKTRPDVVQRALRFVQQIGKLPVVVQDSPGFLVNRVLMPYLVEAANLFEEGYDTEAIDEAMLDFGMPMGPLKLIDEVGVDVSADVAGTLAEKFSARLKMPVLLKQMLEAGLLGRKSGGGFYIHKSREPVVNPQAAKFRRGSAPALTGLQELQRRMILPMINEAARCLEEKVVARADDVDFGMVAGTGFAPFLGGPLAYAESLGLPKIVEELKSLVQTLGPRYEPCELLLNMAGTGRKFYEN